MGEPIETEFTCRLPWSVKDVEGMIHPFHIVVDVLPGPHAFLLGIPTLRKMKAEIMLGHERDNDDEGASSEVTDTKKATRSGTQYFVTTSFFSETQGLMLHVEHGQARRPEHTFRWHHPFASTDEKLEAYAKENRNWISNKAMECISKSSVPKGGNVLKSNVIYKWTNQETLKARIIPDGRGDSQRHFLITDQQFRLMHPE
jgi:hypothetical protein